MADLVKLYDALRGDWIDAPRAWLDVFEHLSETDPNGHGPDGPHEVDLSAMKVPELRAFADKHGVDLGNARKKDEIVTAITEQLGDPAAPTPEDDGHVVTDPDDDGQADDADDTNGADGS